MYYGGTFSTLNIGNSALMAAQIGQDVAGNNISNADTPGYSVESVALDENDPAIDDNSAISSQTSQVGSGVSVGSVARASDEFLNAQARGANAQSGTYTAQQTWLTNVQDAFNEPQNTSINSQLTTFFDNFSSVENSPNDTGVRETAIQGGVTLAGMLNTASQQMDAVGTQLTSAASSDMSDINTYGQQIATLNTAIVSQSAGGQQAPDSLLDQRDALLDKLSSLTNYEKFTNANGSVDVRIGTSNLVEGSDSNTLTLSGLQSSGSLTGGDLYGITTSQASLTGYKANLDTLSSTLISQVNTLHEAGTGEDGSTGVAFFTGTGAGDIAVNTAIVNDPDKLAVAGALTGGATTPAVGDSSNAAALAALGTATLGSSAGALSGNTFNGYYNGLVTQIGSDTANATSNLATAQATNTQLTNQRAQVSGVNEDDEMTSMIKFQRMYEAAAKIVSTQNTMLGDLIGMVS